MFDDDDDDDDNASAVCANALSVCPSICLSVTSWYCTKMAKHRITKTMPHNSPGL